MRFARFAVLALLLVPGVVAAQTPVCDQLEESDKETIREVFAKVRPYECCTDTLATCLAAPAPCALAVRLANSLCRGARLGQDSAALQDAFERRRKSLGPSAPKLAIALDGLAPAGDPQAPVTVVLYACSRCPFCRDVVLNLHREVTEDALRGKVKLYLKPFPLKSHEDALAGDLALTAAARMGKGWPFAQFLFKHFGEFHPDVLPDWAQSVGLDRDEFEKALSDEKTRQALAESKKEGVRNRVNGTPTVFIDGRQYHGDLESGALVDALLEQHERVTSAASAKAR